MSAITHRRRAALLTGLALSSLALLTQCRSAGAGRADARASLDGWDTVYRVLQHPRCLNCHPAGDRPLQGDLGLEHAQNVQRGPDGRGLYAMACATCHQATNAPDAHQPPGAPHWQLPRPEEPLVFEGRSSSELCRQLRDPAHNGGRSHEALLEHMTADPLVLWGWDPGPGRTPVPIAQPAFAAAARAWVEGGCRCP